MSDAALAPLERRLESLDAGGLSAEYRAQGEFIAVSGFLPPETVAGLLGALPALEPSIHRNFIPRHKKGGSISRFDLDREAPLFGALYALPALRSFFETVTGAVLRACPESDPHTYALYYYTEPGDHIGWHYDTSYYRGARYTVLLGLVDESSCRLEYELHAKDPDRPTEAGSVSLDPGMLVVFNGDKLNHRVTPLGEGEKRVALTLEYVTSANMHPFLRFVSNMKDSIAYFGFRQVFRGRTR